MKYEYLCQKKSFSGDAEAVTKFLNDQASEGWQYMNSVDAGGVFIYYFFRKELPLKVTSTPSTFEIL